ncbi:hypothetical protein F5887DRAFT_1003321 [Amanita rubescens]|nr:hypothetical protein F5887DRAFT_1003321 [Amanita rubescens]
MSFTLMLLFQALLLFLLGAYSMATPVPTTSGSGGKAGLSLLRRAPAGGGMKSLFATKTKKQAALLARTEGYWWRTQSFLPGGRDYVVYMDGKGLVQPIFPETLNEEDYGKAFPESGSSHLMWSRIQSEKDYMTSVHKKESAGLLKSGLPDDKLKIMYRSKQVIAELKLAGETKWKELDEVFKVKKSES